MTCGEHQLNVEESSEVNLPVTQVIVHPKYKSAPIGYDIAVYKVGLFVCLMGLVEKNLFCTSIFLKWCLIKYKPT